MKFAAVGEFSQNRGLHFHFLGQLQEAVEIFRRDGQSHALLGLREKNLPGVQSGILQGGFFQMEFTSVTVPGHLAHRGGKPAGAIVRNRMV